MKRFFLLLAVCLPALAQTPLPPINAPVFRAFDANGKPLTGGKLYTYAAGTSTPLATYSDAGAVTPNTNPVVLDSTGSAKVFLASASYKFILQDKNGVQQWTVDNISGAPPTGSVQSVFGRTGTVVAVTGDYTCSQITGAICSVATIYYQNVVNDGTPVSPQRGKLGLLSGSGIAVTCADNSGSTETDCTFALAGGTGTPRTCNANGCFVTYTDGTIVQWGEVGGCGSGAPFCNVAVTFPTSFTTTSNLAISVTVQNGLENFAANVRGAPTTSNFVLNYAALVFVGGAGLNLTGSQTAFYIAIGH